MGPELTFLLKLVAHLVVSSNALKSRRSELVIIRDLLLTNQTLGFFVSITLSNPECLSRIPYWSLRTGKVWLLAVPMMFDLQWCLIFSNGVWLFEKKRWVF